MSPPHAGSSDALKVSHGEYWKQLEFSLWDSIAKEGGRQNSGGQHAGTAASAITLGAFVLVFAILPLFQYRAIQAALRRLDAEGKRR
jgi:hypothetical protein